MADTQAEGMQCIFPEATSDWSFRDKGALDTCKLQAGRVGGKLGIELARSILRLLPDLSAPTGG